MRNVTQDGININKRFFEALDHLKANKQIKGLEDFANRYGVNQGNLSYTKHHIDTSSVKPELIMYLVRDFCISADWILMGTGELTNVQL